MWRSTGSTSYWRDSQHLHLCPLLSFKSFVRVVKVLSLGFGRTAIAFSLNQVVATMMGSAFQIPAFYKQRRLLHVRSTCEKSVRDVDIAALDLIVSVGNLIIGLAVFPAHAKDCPKILNSYCEICFSARAYSFWQSTKPPCMI